VIGLWMWWLPQGKVKMMNRFENVLIRNWSKLSFMCMDSGNLYSGGTMPYLYTLMFPYRFNFFTEFYVSYMPKFDFVVLCCISTRWSKIFLLILDKHHSLWYSNIVTHNHLNKFYFNFLRFKNKIQLAMWFVENRDIFL
jgi:hypothetical protein